ncbi:MAG: DUF4333 domain-containing protein [Candidatus Nanopelagicales bacterium]|nr:DUF4333 domain-containing protein [Candidatus Nanopelagicales bacterium]
MSAAMLAACSSVTTLNTEEAQAAISKGLTDQLGGTYTVTCPESIEAKANATFTCDVTDTASGATAVVTATQTNDQGNIDWEITESSSATPEPAAS